MKSRLFAFLLSFSVGTTVVLAKLKWNAEVDTAKASQLKSIERDLVIWVDVPQEPRSGSLSQLELPASF